MPRRMAGATTTPVDLRDEWETPDDFIRVLCHVCAIPHFDLDPCATRQTAKADFYFGRAQNGLIQSWKRGDVGVTNVYVNPPYSQQPAWMAKARCEARQGGVRALLLLPNGTGNREWAEHVVTPDGPVPELVGVYLVTGRIRFVGSGKHGPNWDSVVLEYGDASYWRSPRVHLASIPYQKLRRELDLVPSKRPLPGEKPARGRTEASA